MTAAPASHSSVLIVGGGIFGTSTAYHLSQLPSFSPHCPSSDDASSSSSNSNSDNSDNSNSTNTNTPTPLTVTLLDRAPPPPCPAASTDVNKIIRADYPSRFYCDLAYHAMHSWRTSPVLRPFYHASGWIALEATGSTRGAQCRQNFRDRGHDPTSDVGLSELEGRWGGVLQGIETQGMQGAYWNPEAGWAEAGAATAALMREAVGQGVRYEVGEAETLLLGDGRVVGVKTAEGRMLTADKVVLATGAWTSAFMSGIEDAFEMPASLRMERQVTAVGICVPHYRLSEEETRELAEKMPVVVYGEEGEAIPPPVHSRLLKFTNMHAVTNSVTTRSGHRISMPPERDQRDVPEKLKQKTRESVTAHFMQKYTREKEEEYWRLCWDARTPTQDWLLDRHPHAALHNLYFAVGGSLHSYKFLPIAGKYMVNVLTGEGNGEVMDKAWGWKHEGAVSGEGVHPDTEPKWELSEFG